MKAFVFAISMTMASSVFAAQGVYGTWKLPQMAANNFTIDMSLIITANSVTAHALCQSAGQTGTADAVAPATITATQINILQAAQSQTTSNTGLNCNASVSAATLNYTVSADDKTLTITDSGQSMSIPRQ